MEKEKSQKRFTLPQRRDQSWPAKLSQFIFTFAGPSGGCAVTWTCVNHAASQVRQGYATPANLAK